MSQDPKSTYYDAGGIETIDIIKAKLPEDAYIGYLVGNALKYVSRMLWKHDDYKRDCEKAIMYLTLLLKL